MTKDVTENIHLEIGRIMIEIIKKNWCPERSKREDLTMTAELPSDLKKRLELDLLDINR